MLHILFNPKANCGKNFDATMESLRENYAGHECVDADITQIDDLKAYFDSLDAGDEVVLVGGDGTISTLCNKLRGYQIKNNIYLFKAGSGNDFLRDVECDEQTQAVQINKYIENLPVVTVKGREYLFVNNVGFGIDGKVCTAAEDLRAKGKEEINYTTLAIKLLLTSYKSNGAVVTVDDKSRSFKKVWLAPIMNGRFYGGGMMPCPQQDRNGDELSCCVVHSTNALQTLMLFPSLFKGEHVKNEKKVEVMSGKEIKVEFDRPQDVQIDGEVIRDVTEISAVKYSQLALQKKEETAI